MSVTSLIQAMFTSYLQFMEINGICAFCHLTESESYPKQRPELKVFYVSSLKTAEN